MNKKAKLNIITALGGSLCVLVLVQLACSGTASIPTPTLLPTLTQVFPYDYPIDGYINILPVKARDTFHPYIKGTIVIIDKSWVGDSKWRPYSFFPAPFFFTPVNYDRTLMDHTNNELVSNDPNQVGTIIWIDCKTYQTGSYSNGMPAYETDCTVTVIDKAENLIVGITAFRAPPPEEISCPENGSCPEAVLFPDGVLQYIESLPTKK